MNLYEKALTNYLGQGSLSEVRSQESEVRSSNNKLVQQNNVTDTSSKTISTNLTNENKPETKKLLTPDFKLLTSICDQGAKEFKLGIFIPTVAELRANQEQLWYWLKVIADRLGVTITGVKENINSG